MYIIHIYKAYINKLYNAQGEISLLNSRIISPTTSPPFPNDKEGEDTHHTPHPAPPIKTLPLPSFTSVISPKGLTPRAQSARLASARRDMHEDMKGSGRSITDSSEVLKRPQSARTVDSFKAKSTPPPAVAWMSNGFPSEKNVWSIEGFLSLPSKMISGPPFKVGNYVFHLNLHPWGFNLHERQHISLYVVLDGIFDNDKGACLQYYVYYSICIVYI